MSNTKSTAGTGTDYIAQANGHVEQAYRWIGEEPAAVSAPVDAQLSTTYALLAIAEELRDLREAIERQTRR